MAIGLDIGSYSIKIVEMVKAVKGYRRSIVAVERVPNNPSEAQIIDTIKRTAKRASIKSKRVNISISGENLVVKYIHMPRMTLSELRESLKLETEKYIPYNINDVVLDYHILQRVSPLDNKKMFVLLVAAKKKFVEEHIKLTLASGLEPDIVDIDSFCLLRAFIFDASKRLKGFKKNSVVAVINIGNSITVMNVFMNDVSFFCRDVSIGGNLITKSIQERFSMDFESAESLKCEPKDKVLEVFEAIKPVLNNIVRELTLSFEYCESQLGKSVEVLYLTGGSSQLGGIDKFLNESLDMEIVRLDNPALIVATGLALGGIKQYGLFRR